MEILTGDEDMKSQDFVLRTQQTATKEGFSKVSSIWYNKTMCFEDGLSKLEDEHKQMRDVTVPIGQIQTVVEGTSVKFLIQDEAYQPTEWALSQIAQWSDAGTWYVNQLTVPKLDQKGKLEYNRDEQDAATLKTVLDNGLRRIKQDKKFLVRIGLDKRLRAFLTESYAIIDNRWFLDTLSKLIPGGRLSHWRGDMDTIYGNVLIPDTVRSETDSDYGGMLSVGNSEIGIRRTTSLPSIFRAICMNGTVWGSKKGEAIAKVHRGKINLSELSDAIKKNLDTQIPLLPSIIDEFMKTRLLTWDGESIKPLFAEVANSFKMNKKQATSLLQAFAIEKNQTPDLANTLFGVINSITRSGQTLDNQTWVSFDIVGGQLAKYGQKEWDSLTSRAKTLSVKDVESVFSNAA